MDIEFGTWNFRFFCHFATKSWPASCNQCTRRKPKPNIKSLATFSHASWISWITYGFQYKISDIHKWHHLLISVHGNHLLIPIDVNYFSLFSCNRYYACFRSLLKHSDWLRDPVPITESFVSIQPVFSLLTLPVLRLLLSKAQARTQRFS